MNIGEMLQQTGALGSISRELGLDQAATQSAAEALLPSILGGFQKQAQPANSGAGGLADILGGLASGGLRGGGLLDAVVGSAPTPLQPGNDILGQIFGSKDVSRTVADHAAQSTGISPDILKKMLPLLAMAVTGYLASQSRDQSQSGAGAASGGLGGILGQVLGGGGGAGGLGGLTSMLDLNGNGNPLDDILGMAGRLRK